jgi:DNA-binding beta-propeller fold protein YncE
MNHHTTTRKGAGRLHLVLVAALVAGLALSVWPTPSVHAAAGSTIFAITTTNTLLRFDSGAPGTILSTTAVSGLPVGENLLGIDFRPANGQLYGLGSTSHLYIIDSTTGTATQVGTSPFGAALSGTNFGFDFNPVSESCARGQRCRPEFVAQPK